LCQSRSSAAGTAGSVPAVLYLTPAGKIESVVIPGDGGAYEANILKLFPADIQPLVISHPIEKAQFTDEAMEHIEQRRNDPTIPPMIVESGIPLP
jgi:hypothetical protein